MANVVNLNKFRKRKAKADRQRTAEVNRRLHGRTQAERAREALQKQQLTRSTKGARLEGPRPNAPSAVVEDDGSDVIE